MNIHQKLIFHVTSVLALLGLFQLFVGFQMSLATAIFLLILLAIDVAGDLWTLLTIKKDLAQVRDGMLAISKGNLSVDVRVDSKGEVAELQTAMAEMTSYLKEVALVAEAMSRGDLTKSVTPKGAKDRFGTAIAEMVAGMREMVAQVRLAADEVGSGASQIRSSSESLARTAGQQVSSAQETVFATEDLSMAVDQTGSSIAELAASIQQVASSVSHANQVSEETSDAARAGEQAVEESMHGMRVISETMGAILSTIRVLDERSAEIGSIIETIEDIADQTNLLALNAAIEAARAGEQGRGFAVVAEEVRKLAERSTRATGEIAQLIKGIQSEMSKAVGVTQQGAAKIDEGSRLAGRTHEALEKIKQGAEQLATVLAQITATTNEQARASSLIASAADQMTEINRMVSEAVAGLSQVAQDASGATQEVVGTAEHLSRQAGSLQEVVSFFLLEDQALELRVGPSLSLPSGY